MSMMCPPQSVKIASTPSVLSARATRWPPVISAGASAGACSVISAAVLLMTSRTPPFQLGGHPPTTPRRRLTIFFVPAGPRPCRSADLCLVRLVRLVGALGLPQVVHVLVDVHRQLERVVADEPLGDVRVALLERLDDLHVVDDRVGE